MFQCYLCQQDLISDETESEEHIIPNAIGGRLTSRKLLCIGCNNSLGSSIDADLANQFNPIAAMLNIRRDRGKPKAFDAQMESSGEKYKIEPGGKPRLLRPEIDRNTSTITANSLQQIETILTREQKRGNYLNLDRDDTMNKIRQDIEQGKLSTQKYLNGPIKFNIQLGGFDFWRAICKIATNFYIFSGKDSQYISHLIPYIKDGIEPSRPYAYFFNKDNLFPKYLEKEQVIHSLYLQGDPDNKIIYMVMEFFSTFQFTVLLSDSYDEEGFKCFYSYDPLERKCIESNYDLKISPDEINQVLLSGRFDSTIFIKRNDELWRFIEKKQTLNHLSELNNSTVQNNIDQVPEGELIPEEVWNNLVEQIALNVAQVQTRKIMR